MLYQKDKQLNFEIDHSADFERQINNYIQLINQPTSSIENVEVESKKLFQTLLNPVFRSLKLEMSQLIILPDGLLNYIPFESLIQENGNYLVQDFDISYANSATLLYQLKSNNKRNKLLAFAPSFKQKNSLNLNSLPNNTLEVKNIMKSFKGEEYINENATKQNFIKSSTGSSIYHFATHAIYNDVVPSQSFLAFTPNSKIESQLFVNEVYNLDMINTNMVTLSACETGVGELKKGEGFISLARAFFYSGAKSITSTLWQINDASSSTIMNDYYQQLSKGKTKSKALQLAKVDYLESNQDTNLSHPYYWSAFIVSGNNEPLTKQFNYWYLLLAIPVILLVRKLT